MNAASQVPGKYPTEELATAPRLEVLQLDFSPVQATDLLRLAGIRTLKHLSLTGSGLLESESQALLDLRPDLDGARAGGDARIDRA